MSEIKYIRGYPEYMRELIDIVNKTRMERKDYDPPAMSKNQREEVLKLHQEEKEKYL